jgi:hypothetical protein
MCCEVYPADVNSEATQFVSGSQFLPEQGWDSSLPPIITVRWRQDARALVVEVWKPSARNRTGVASGFWNLEAQSPVKFGPLLN